MSIKFKDTIDGSIAKNSATATKLETARTLTIGSKGKTFDGSDNVSWSLSEIGAAASSHNHDDRYYTESEINTKVSALQSEIDADVKVEADRAKAAENTLQANIDKKANASHGNHVPTTQTANNAKFLRNDNTWQTVTPGNIGAYTKTEIDSKVTTINNAISGKADSSHGNHVPATQTANNAVFLRNDNTWQTITPGNIGAAKSSHGTHVTYASATPLVAGTGAVGTSSKVAREDHVHPAQTSVSGNAGTATKLASAKTITIGNKGKTFDGSANVSWTLSEIGAKAAEPTTFGLQTDYVAVRTTGRTAAQYYEFWDTGDAGWAGIKAGAIYDNNNRVYSASNKPTLSELGAAAESHGTHVTYASSAPKANGTAAVGSSAKVAREDHVHPLQTSVSGNAGTATKLATARTINGTSFDGSGNITTANWGSSRNISISDSDGTNTGTAVSVNGAANATLKLPATIKASLSGNATTATTATKAGKWSTARTLTIGSTGKAVDGSGNVSWSLTEIGAAASSHGHDTLSIKGTDTITSTTNDTTAKWGAQGTSVHWYTQTGQLIDQPAQWGFLLNVGKDSEVHQLWMTQASGDLRHRGGNSDGWSGTWRTILDTSNYTTHVTPANIGAAKESHGTHVTYATAAPKANGEAAIGSVNRVAREDHVHPLQTSVSGNAGTATKLATGRTITIGNKGKTFDGSAGISFTLAEIGAEPIAKTVVSKTKSGTTLTLSTDRYQKASLASGDTIALPSATTYTEIELFVKDCSLTNINLPDNCKWRVDHNLSAGTSFIIRFVYTTQEWLGEIKIFS